MLSIAELVGRVETTKQVRGPESSEPSLEDRLKQEVDAVFRRVDADGNGFITEEELYTGVNTVCGGILTRAEAKKVMTDLDIDLDGYIDLEEFRQFMLTQLLNGIVSAEDTMQDLYVLLKHHDIAGKGWLTPSETTYILEFPLELCCSRSIPE